jgi:hypothetical protein
MKTNKSLTNGCIGDNNVGYNTKMGGYATFMSDINELGEIIDETSKGHWARYIKRRTP